MTPLLYGIILALGMAVAQDAVASIWYYWRKENWGNQMFRVGRLLIGLALIIIAGLALGRL